MNRACIGIAGSVLGVMLTSLAAVPPTPADDETEAVTFLVTSDCHYEVIRNVDRNDRNRATIERMNALPGEPWPEQLGGGKIGTPRGVLVLGDLIDDGDRRDESPGQWRNFEQQFGLDGTDGLLKYPVFEGWGNHDGPPVGTEKFGFSVQARIKDRNVRRRKAGRIGNVSENGLHYSWDWGKVHFVQMNLYPADRQHPKVRYSLPWHDPQGAFTFVKHDLQASIGDSGRSVVVLSHCGFDTDWWHPDDWAAFYEAVKPYNVIAYFYGHTGTGLRKWAPEGEEKPIDCINTGQTEKGFFVVEITAGQMRLGYHTKKDPKVIDAPEWEWKFLLDKPLGAPRSDDTRTGAVPDDSR
jgi:cytolysin (calcineurin-like family phosphatase)